MFDLDLVNLIYCPRRDQFMLDRIFKAYAEVGLRYRVWSAGRTGFSTLSYTYVEDMSGVISQNGTTQDLDLVVWCLPERVFNLDFCLRKYLGYLRSIFAGPIVFIINDVEKIEDVSEPSYLEPLYPACYVRANQITWEGDTYSLQASYSEKSEWELIFFRDWKLKSILE